MPIRMMRRCAAVMLALLLAVSCPVAVLADEGDDLDFGQFDAEETTIGETEDDEVGEESILILDEEAEDEEVAEEAPPRAHSAGGAMADLLNGADLSPRSPGSATLDAYLDELMDELLDDGMDTYEQVKACYDYLVDTVRYGSHMSKLGTPIADGVTCRDVYSAYGEVEGFGAVALTAKQGLCNAYASAFIMMSRKIGLDAYLVKGSTKSRGGGYAYHEWAEINIDGQVYLFDPQLEQDLVKAGLPQYSVFCKTYDQVSGRYSR